MEGKDSQRATVVDSLVDAISAEILGGRRRPGGRLPTIRTLAEEYGVTIPTVQRALARLKEMNLVTVRQGRGTTILDPATHAGLSAISRWIDALLDRPKRARKVLDDFLELRREMSSAQFVAIRNLEDGGDLTNLRDAVAEFAEIVEESPEDEEVLAAADMKVARSFLSARPQVAFAAVFNALEELLVALPELREAIYADPASNVAGYEAALELSASSVNDSRLREQLRELMRVVDEETGDRFETILEEKR